MTNSEADAVKTSGEFMSFNTRITKGPSDATMNKLDKPFMSIENLVIPSLEGVEMTTESRDIVTFNKIEPSCQRNFILESKSVYRYINPPTKAVSSDVSISDQVKYKAAPKRIFTNPAPPATSGIPFCNEDPFFLNKEEYLNDVIYIKIFNNHAPPATSGISFCNEDIFCLNKGEYQNNVIRSEHDSTFVRLYRNIIRNETCRMMMNIDIVVYEAKHLFGVVRTQIFFDLLDDELFNFGSPQAISNFLPNMAESAVRQHVTSFFEHACGMMNRLMTLLLHCPDSNKLQQMPEPTFISLLQSVIDSFLSNKTKREHSDQGTQIIRLIMVAPGLFVVAVGEEIPKDILVRFRHGDETVMNSFVDAGLERMQSSEIQDNRLIHSPYFPSDCRLFIYIPTEQGSYWHKIDMQRDNRIRQHL